MSGQESGAPGGTAYHTGRREPGGGERTVVQEASQGTGVNRHGEEACRDEKATCINRRGHDKTRRHCGDIRMSSFPFNLHSTQPVLLKA